MFANVCAFLKFGHQMNNTKNVSIEFFFDKRRSRKKGNFPLKLRLTYDRKTNFIPLSIYLQEEEYEKLMSGKRLSEELYAIKQKIDGHKERANSIMKNIHDFNFDRFKIEFTGAKIVQSSNDQSIRGLFEELKQTMFRKPATVDADNSAMNSLKSYFESINSKKGIDSHISVLNVEFLKRWQYFLMNDGQRPKSVATVGSYSRHIRIVMNMALEKGFISKDQYPFTSEKKQNKKKVRISSARTRKKVLSKANMKTLMDLELNPISLECFSRDWFTLSYLCCGINVADLLELRNKDLTHDGFSFYRVKVKDTSESSSKFIEVQFIDELREITMSIINRLRSVNMSPKTYLFPIYTNQMNEREKLTAKRNLIRKINQHLPKVAKIAELENENLSYGIARHTFASILHEAKVPSLIIANLLGHSNTTTTDSYLHSLPGNPEKKAMQQLL
jgi:integrase/recombinase XerD